MKRQRRTPDRHPVTGQRVSDLTSVELHRQLVTDAIGGIETPLPWFVAAVDRIARLDRSDPETVYRRFRTEVLGLGGVLPGAPGL